MGFKPNFEINFLPSKSSFMNDKEEGLTHSSAGMTTEFIVLGEGSEDLEARISTYGDEDFLDAGGSVRQKVRTDIIKGVKELIGITESGCGHGCLEAQENVGTAREILEGIANGSITEMGKRNIKGKSRKAIASSEAQVQLENCEEAVKIRCLNQKGEDDLEKARLDLENAQKGLVGNSSISAMQMGGGNNVLFILGGAVILGGILFSVIKK